MPRITESEKIANEKLQSDYKTLLINKEEQQRTNEELIIENGNLLSLNKMATIARDYADSIIATVREPMLILDKNLRVKTANQAFYTFFLVNEKQTERNLIYNLGNRQWDIPTLRNLLEEILPDKKSFVDFEITHNFPEIGEKQLLLNAREIINITGSEKLILLAIEDYTERNEAKRLAASELFNRNLLENNPDCVKLLNKEGRITFMNNNGMCLMEVDDFKNIENIFWWQMWADKHQDIVINSVKKAVEGEKIQFQAFQETAKGTPKWWDVIVSSVEIAGEQQILSVSRDITEQVLARNKNLENEQRHSKELEEKVQQRTLELSNANELLNTINIEKEKRAAELVIANKELLHESSEKEKRSAELAIANKELHFQNEEKEKRADELGIANKELLAFNYISSHDLQEPLRKIQTFASLIAENEYEVLSAKGKDYFHRMEDSAKRMQTLIEDLLAYSRTSVPERNFVKTDIKELIEEVVYDIAELLQQKNVTIKLNDICEADIIPFQIRQVMNNLITNAIKFTKTNVSPIIEITCKVDNAANFANEIAVLSIEKLSPKKDYCRITIKDNGIGFHPQYKDKIFEVFQRLHGKKEYAGTGIGLAIVKKIIQNHNGLITAEGRLEKGATFSLYLPVL